MSSSSSQSTDHNAGTAAAETPKDVEQSACTCGRNLGEEFPMPTEPIRSSDPLSTLINMTMFADGLVQYIKDNPPAPAPKSDAESVEAEKKRECDGGCCSHEPSDELCSNHKCCSHCKCPYAVITWRMTKSQWGDAAHCYDRFKRLRDVEKDDLFLTRLQFSVMGRIMSGQSGLDGIAGPECGEGKCCRHECSRAECATHECCQCCRCPADLFYSRLYERYYVGKVTISAPIQSSNDSGGEDTASSSPSSSEAPTILESDKVMLLSPAASEIQHNVMFMIMMSNICDARPALRYSI